MRLYRGESARVSISKSSSTWILHGEHTTQVFHILKPKKQDTLRFRFRLIPCEIVVYTVKVGGILLPAP